MDRVISAGRGRARTIALHALAIIVLAVLPFAVAVGAPFTFDDTDYITGSPLIPNPELILSGGPPPGGGELGPNVALSVRTRALGHLSFALSYRLGGYSPAAFRIWNIALHAANGLLLYALVLSLLAAPRLMGAEGVTRPEKFALAIAALFVLHPTAAESVTYVSQRFTSLAAFFSLGSLLCYTRARLGGPGAWAARRAALPALATLFCLGAMLSKETAFTLPLVAVAIELTCFTGSARERLLSLAPLLALMPLIPVLKLDPLLPFGDALMGAARGGEAMPRLAYFLTQPRVIMTYIRLSAFPVNLTLDYDYPIAEWPLEPGVLAPALAVILAFALGLRAIGSRRPGARLAGLGIVWFLLSLAVESSVIPLNDVIFEHRMYFPLVGLALAAGAAFLPQGRAAVVLVALVPVLFGTLAVERNLEWRDPRVLWRDTARKAPLKPRPWNSLGIAYLDRGGIDEAEAAFRLAMAREPRYAEAWNNLAIAHMLKGRPERAREDLGEALAIRPDYPDAHLNLGGVYEAMGDLDRAEAEYRRAAELKPSLVQAPMRLGLLLHREGRHGEAETWLLGARQLAPRDAGAAYALGVLYAETGRMAEAERAYNEALALDPAHADARVNLGSLYLARGRPDRAEAEYRKAIMANPGHPLAHYNLGRIFEQRRDWAGALREYDQALGADTTLDRAWNNRGVVLARLGRWEEAREAFGRALALAPENADYALNMNSALANTPGPPPG